MEKKKDNKRNWMFLFIAAGIAVVIYGGWQLSRGISSYTWPSCEGKIITSKVTMSSSHRLRDNKGISYYPDVDYEYVVDGKKYIGEKIFYGQYGSGMRDKIQKIADKYPAGKMVTVYYNPKNPGEAVLERGIRWSIFLALILGLIFVGVGIILYKYWDILNNQQPQFVRREELDK